MKKFLPLLAASLTALGTSASAVTFNESNARCIVCSATTSEITTSSGQDLVVGLQTGDKFLYTNDAFLDNNVGFDAIVEVIDVSAQAATNGWASSINLRGVNEYMWWRFTFIEENSIDANNPNGITKTIGENRFINVTDIDSNAGIRGRDNFTDVAGVNKTPTGNGAALEEGAFLPGSAAPNPADVTDFTFYRLRQDWEPTRGNGNDDSSDWFVEGNFGRSGVKGVAEDYSVSFDGGSNFTGFDFIWGSTGVPSTNVRGFNLALDSNPAVTTAPIPLPASAFLLFGGLGGLAAVRRRARRAQA